MVPDSLTRRYLWLRELNLSLINSLQEFTSALRSSPKSIGTVIMGLSIFVSSCCPATYPS